MFNFLLSTAPLSVGDILSVGGQVTLLGMGMVFSVLVLLWGLVEFLHLLLGHKNEKKVKIETQTVVHSVVETPKSEVVTAPVPEPEVAPKDDLAIIAVITAAIAAASGQSPSSFRVVSFKRANNKFSYRK